MKIGLDTTFLVEVSVREHPGHLDAMEEMHNHLSVGDTFFLSPQVIAEFVHVITDSRRFEHPLLMPEALEKARTWWHARETRHALITSASIEQFYVWMHEFNLGRKRVLDTMLAATYITHQVSTILSSNARDYKVFGCFTVITPGQPF
jgi:predicted nucleic acid-binding protein